MERNITNNTAPAKVETSLTNVVAVHKDTELQSLEFYQLNRDRFRGNFSTNSITTYCDYINNKPSSDRSTILGFIDQSGMTCTTYFNLIDKEGTAGQADDTATLKLKKTAAFLSLLKHLDVTLSQQLVAEYLEDWHDIITPMVVSGDNKTDLHISAAINSFRNITIDYNNKSEHSESTFSANKSTMENIEVSSKTQLPTHLKITLSPYNEMPETSIFIRVHVKTAEKPFVILRWTLQAADEEKLAVQFEDLIKQKLGNKVALSLGSFTLGR